MEKRAPRLQFTDEERADSVLKKPVRRVQKAAEKADKAQTKIPKKTMITKKRVVEPATGKVTTRLKFEEIDRKKPPSKLTHTVRDAPANAILMQFHREIRQSEDDNVGVEAAHKARKQPSFRPASVGAHIVHTGSLPTETPPKRNSGLTVPTSAIYKKRLCRATRSFPAIQFPTGSKSGQ